MYPLREHGHEVILPLSTYRDNWTDIRDWMLENFGSYHTNDEWDTYSSDITNTAYFVFRCEYKAMAFKLAWI